MAANYGQIVIGAPGSGKTTYCLKLKEYLNRSSRNCIIINLDPANNSEYPEASININELITVNDIMSEYFMGPNGSLLFCIEFLLKNKNWLINKIKKFSNSYLVFDCPGQMELFCSNLAFQELVRFLANESLKLVVVNMIDCIHCSEPTVLFSIILESLSIMLHLEMPHINVLSKIDLFSKLDNVVFPLEFFTETLDLEYLEKIIHKDNRLRKLKGLSKRIVETVQDFNLVSFIGFTNSDEMCIKSLLVECDRVNGYTIDFNDKTNSKGLRDLSYTGTTMER